MNKKLLEIKGDVEIYENEEGKEIHEIATGDIVEIKDGDIKYFLIERIGIFDIKYNVNGIYGYSVFRADTCLEDRIWDLEQAREFALENK